MADSAEQRAQDFFRQHGLRAERIQTHQQGKTPDFIVYDDEDRLVMYAECKYLEPDLADGCKSDPSYSKLTPKIHEAYSQFRDVNWRHIAPNALVFVCDDADMGIEDLRLVLEGYVNTASGQRLDAFGKFAHGRIKDEKYFIDVYVWLQDSHPPWSLLTKGSKHEYIVRYAFRAMRAAK